MDVTLNTFKKGGMAGFALIGRVEKSFSKIYDLVIWQFQFLYDIYFKCLWTKTSEVESQSILTKIWLITISKCAGVSSLYRVVKQISYI